MNYGLRNTIILLVVLLLLVGGGWTYINFWQEPVINKLKQELKRKKNELRQKQQTADRYKPLLERYRNGRQILNNLSKVLIKTGNPNYVFEYLDELNQGYSSIDLNYSYRDSIINPEYGIIQTSIQGSGEYVNLNNFIMNIEGNRALHKVRSLNLSPNGDTEKSTDVTFSFVLESFFGRDSLLQQQVNVRRKRYRIVQNPFFPLIRDLPANKEGLPNVEKSNLAGLTPNKVYLISQNGNLLTLREGERVFMGRLTNINFKQQKATFTLNKGGLIEEITLEVSE